MFMKHHPGTFQGFPLRPHENSAFLRISLAIQIQWLILGFTTLRYFQRYCRSSWVFLPWFLDFFFLNCRSEAIVHWTAPSLRVPLTLVMLRMLAAPWWSRRLREKPTGTEVSNSRFMKLDNGGKTVLYYHLIGQIYVKQCFYKPTKW